MKTVLWFVVVALFLLGGIFEIMADHPILGSLFILLAVANLIIFLKLRKLK